MIDFFKRAWNETAWPFLARPRRRQVAALCYRDGPDGKKVMLITSRGTGRWIVPKGWPIDGLNDSGAALQEAWEEAGVRKARIGETPIGSYRYDKGMNDGASIPIKTQVYLTKVHELADKYPEVKQRKRAWFTPDKAAKLVDEPELKDLLRNI